MNSQFTTVEARLNRVDLRWKLLRFLKHSFVLGTVVTLLILALVETILRGWLSTKLPAIAFLVFLAALGAIAWLILIIAVFAKSPKRVALGAAVERADKRLLDRLNTLLFLESQDKAGPEAESFLRHIGGQTESIMAEKPITSPFPGTRLLPYLFAFVLAIAGLIAVMHFYSPWQRLDMAEKKNLLPPAAPDKPLEIALPDTNNVEQNRSWGEVRITDPGGDIKATKVDVVQLQIEAAANQALRKVDWTSAVNGGEEATHDLPAPTEPRYAVYQPTLFLDELNLSDWDVMTYYAKARTEQEGNFASEVYFIEVRPFREDILKLPGGENGKAYHCLNEMTALIHRQQHIIRQTHQYIQSPPEQENLAKQDRSKLSEAENDLGDSTEHLYAKMAAEMENKPIGDALDNLAKASKTLEQASGLLKENSMKEAPNRERRALMELVSARKMFQKSLSDDPSAFKESSDENENGPVAGSAKKLEQMAEFRNEAKAAEDFLRNTLDTQKKLEAETRKSDSNDWPKLAEQQRQLQKSLDSFEQEHPSIFKGAETEAGATDEALSTATAALENKEGAKDATQNAKEQLAKLDEKVAGHSAGQQLANAYKLKHMLDQQIKDLDEYSHATNTSEAAMQKTVNESRETVNQLKKTAEQEPTRDSFADNLRDALSGTNKVDLDAKLNQLQQAQDSETRKQRSNEAKQGLSKISKAFSDSQPGDLQAAQKADSLKESAEDNFKAGMAQLESLVRQAENQHQLRPEDKAKQAHEALLNLQSGMRSRHGDNDRGNQLLVHLEKMLKEEQGLEVADLKTLMDQLQHFSVETSDPIAQKGENPGVNNIDPTRLPPAYRGRIQKYFQRLSEK